jgi:hypothetical protein
VKKAKEDMKEREEYEHNKNTDQRKLKGFLLICLALGIGLLFVGFLIVGLSKSFSTY